jgi:hypothetical protein
VDKKIAGAKQNPRWKRLGAGDVGDRIMDRYITMLRRKRFDYLIVNKQWSTTLAMCSRRSTCRHTVRALLELAEQQEGTEAAWRTTGYFEVNKECAVVWLRKKEHLLWQVDAIIFVILTAKGSRYPSHLVTVLHELGGRLCHGRRNRILIFDASGWKLHAPRVGCLRVLEMFTDRCTEAQIKHHLEDLADEKKEEYHVWWIAAELQHGRIMRRLGEDA